jgi:hypothetical protein
MEEEASRGKRQKKLSRVACNDDAALNEALRRLEEGKTAPLIPSWIG